MSYIDDNFDLEKEKLKQQVMQNITQEDIQRAIEAHDDKLLDLIGIDPNMKIMLYSGLMATTPIILGDDVTNIYRLYLGHNEEITLGIDLNTGKVVNTRIIGVPQEVNVTNFVTLEFNCGLMLQCTEATKIMAVVEKNAPPQFVDAKLLKVGQEVVGFGVREDSGMSERVFKLIDKKEEENILTLPAYFFLCEHENIFIPSEGGLDGDSLSFIIVHQ